MMMYMKGGEILRGTTYLVAAEFLDDIMDKEEITFVLFASYCAKIKKKRLPKHRHSIADAFFSVANIDEHRRRITQTIGDIIISNKHRRCLPKHVGNIVDVSPRYMQDFLLSIHALNFFSMSRCLGEAWRWRCPGDAQIWPSQKHRED